MVVPGEAATTVSEAEISAAMVEAQMQGRPVKAAVGETLLKHGFTVYERAWGDYMSDFVKSLL